MSGDLSRRTGGNLYDRRMARACNSAGIRLRTVSVASTAQARAELARLAPRVVVIDSIAIPIAVPLLRWMHADLHARVVALMHMPSAAPGARELFRRADRVIAVSADLARTLVRAGALRSRLTVIPPGSDGVARISRRARRVRGDPPLRVLAVANWSPSKGIATLVAAAARVPGIRLDLVGDVGTGAYRDNVLRRIAERGLASRISVHGAQGERALARSYGDADVFALPTVREGYGIVFGEALAHGLPVVAVDIPSVRAIVGDAGLFVPPRRVRPLAAALRLMTDEWLRRRLARAARVRARALPRWRTSEAAFVAVVVNEIRASESRS